MMTGLETLHDIDLPPPVGAWPPAPGWALLLVLLLVLSVFAWRWGRVAWRRYRIRRQALSRCDRLEQLYKTRGIQVCNHLSVLLRRVTLAFHAPEDAARVGQDWIEFLRSTSRQDTWQTCDCSYLLRLPYRAKATAETLPLIAACRRWIKQQG